MNLSVFLEVSLLASQTAVQEPPISEKSVFLSRNVLMRPCRLIESAKIVAKLGPLLAEKIYGLQIAQNFREDWLDETLLLLRLDGKQHA